VAVAPDSSYERGGLAADWYVDIQCSLSLQLLYARHNRLTISAGSFSELLGNLDDAIVAYEHALRANPNSIQAMNSISLILRTREEFPKAVEYLNAIIKLDANNGEAWGSLGMLIFQKLSYMWPTNTE